ncbi:hypothetical protein BKA70DRAFT_1427731 [Coprinopsis sp. MPI-PUGE-AT-0042]|nr:hypothetical protein BKA70DRAFT_1427731 [Coprinopsis sp. MPI-PUGE-AT-0042]
MDGGDDDHPIILPYPNVTPQKLDSLLVYLFCGPTEHENTDDFIINVLELSAYLQIDDGRAYAIKAFEDRGFAFNPILQFRLARTYGIDKWIEPATRRILRFELSAITHEEAGDIGFASYYEIVRMKVKILELRTLMALAAPPFIHSPNCHDRLTCAESWKREWWNTIAPHILNPDDPMAGERLKIELECSELLGVCSKCQALTTTSMEIKGHFDKEELILEECIRRIKDLHGDKTPSLQPIFNTQTHSPDAPSYSMRKPHLSLSLIVSVSIMLLYRSRHY